MPPRQPRRGGGKPDRKGQEKKDGRAPAPGAQRKDWGSVARRGARAVGDPGEDTASQAWREAVRAARSDRGRPARAADGEVWVQEPAAPVRDAASRAISRGAATRRAPEPTARRTAATPAKRGRTRRLPPDVAAEVGRLAEPTRSTRVQEALADAARTFERGRYRDAERVLARLVAQVPGAAAVRELRGLTLYRLGRWRPAIRELEAFRALTGSVDQHPVLADCRRALGQHRQVEKLWEELREASPDAGLVAEGRIVAAGSLADRGEVQQAIKLLERTPAATKRPRPHHLRVWYALADLYERAGDVTSARELFRRVASHQPDFADVAERLASLD